MQIVHCVSAAIQNQRHNLFLETSADREKVVDTNLLFNIHIPKLNIVRSQENHVQNAMSDFTDNHVNSNGSISKVRSSLIKIVILWSDLSSFLLERIWTSKV